MFCCLRPFFVQLFCFFYLFFFFLRTLKIHRMADKGKDDSYSSLLLLPAHHHSDIYLQLCFWGDSALLLIATRVINRLLKREARVFSILPSPHPKKRSGAGQIFLIKREGFITRKACSNEGGITYFHPD